MSLWTHDINQKQKHIREGCISPERVTFILHESIIVVVFVCLHFYLFPCSLGKQCIASLLLTPPLINLMSVWDFLNGILDE